MKLITFLIFVSYCSHIFAFDVSLLKNNKESYSRIISNYHQQQIKKWLATQDQNNFRIRINQFLKDSIDFYQGQGQCELNLIRLMADKASYYGLISEKIELSTLFSYLRSENIIDDIFLKILFRLLEIENQISDLELNRPSRPFNTLTDVTRKLDTTKIYLSFKALPDEKNECVIANWRNMVSGLGWYNLKNRDSLLKKLNFIAFEKGDIDLSTYWIIEVLRSFKVIDWEISLYQYFDIVKNAKDKLQKKSPSNDLITDFSSSFVSRKEKVTHRERLYQNYSSTQIMMMAEIINKTSRRLDAKRVSINFEHSEMPSESEIYVLSPMERYRLSIKMLRKDMAETMRSDLFQGKNIQYEDLVSAAYETGLIKSQDLELILKFEEFWNPQIPRWKMYANFAFQMAGSASFYLPVPFNLLGALALAITQTKVINQDQKPDPNDNWNVVI